MRQLIPLALILAVAAAVAFLMFGGNGAVAPPSAVEPSAEQPVPGAVTDAVADFGRETAERVGVEPALPGADDGRSTGWALRVVGRVVDPAGAGIAQAEVFARKRPDFGFGGGGGRGPGRDFDVRAFLAGENELGTAVARSDQVGRYAFTIPLGEDERLEIAARREGLAPASGGVDFDTYDETTSEVFAEDLVLDLGTTVRGAVVDGNGNGIAGATVTAQVGRGGPGRGRGGRGGRFGGRDSYAAALVPAVETDSLGGFELRAVPRGAWMVTAQASGYLEGSSDTIETDGSAPVEGVQIEVTLGAPLSGRVVDKGGAPIAAAVVTAMQRPEFGGADAAPEPGTPPEAGRGREWQRFLRARVTAQTDAEGEFVFDAVPRGAIRVEVEHPQFLTERREPVEALATPRLEFLLAERLVVAGTVVDAADGTPLESFGIAARSLELEGRFGAIGGGMVGGWREPGGDRTERPRRGAETGDARDDYYRTRIGGAGLIAGETPEPTRHAGGKFEIRDLLPGRYALDVAAPGYVAVAAAIVELDAQSQALEVTLRVPRGTLIRGLVVDAADGSPVARTRVELRVPPPPEDRAQAAPTAEGDPRDGMRRAMRAVFAGERGGIRIAEAMTDASGRFALGPVLPGTYALSASRRGYTEFENDALWVPAERETAEVRVALAAGAVVRGRVVDYAPGERLRVAFTRVEDGAQQTARVDRESGEYEMRGLEEGAYFVEVEEDARGGRDGRRGGFEARLQALAGRVPHLTVVPGQALQYDVLAHPVDIGRVAGLVLDNGAPAEGYDVRLERVDDGTLPVESDPARARIVERIVGRMLRARVGGDGRFEIDEVLPGTYWLEVSAGGRGGRGGRGGFGGGGDGTAVHREQVVVGAGTIAEVQIAFASGSLSFALRGENGAELPRGVQVAIVAAAEAGDRAPEDWRGLESYTRLQPRGGVASAESIAVGSYRYAVTGMGIEPIVGDVAVSGPGEARTVELVVREQSAADFVKQLDADGDGRLSGEELPELLRRRIDRLDTDGDQALSVEELQALRERAEAREPAAEGRRPGGRGR